jgi:hypothetical protein
MQRLPQDAILRVAVAMMDLVRRARHQAKTCRTQPHRLDKASLREAGSACSGGSVEVATGVTRPSVAG